ncbi:MAG: PQQ-binding-like beta-propeller repeat protein [Jatrophihabitans sp.]
MREPSTPLAGYTHRLRRQRIVYFSVVTAIVVVLGVIVGVAWSRGEVAKTTLATAVAPPALPLGVPGPSPALRWKTGDHLAIGTPQWGGTVVGYSTHTVRGRNARTGAQTWSYTRSNRSVCTAAQLGGVTVAVYELAGNCDEVTAVDSSTGARKWTRTLDMDGMPVAGHPNFQTSAQGTSHVLLATTGSVMYALDPATGNNWWTYSRPGCAIAGAALGTNDVLISQDCTTPNCGKLKFCGRGPQLLLRKAYDSRDDNCKTNRECETNPDKIIWNRLGNTGVPASADGLISAYDARSHTLEHLAAGDGRSVATTPLSPAPLSGAGIHALATTEAEIVWAAGVTYAIGPATGAPVWRASTNGPPTLVTGAAGDTPVLYGARITVPSAGGAASLDGTTGHVAQTFSLGGSGAIVYPLGSGFLVGSPDGTAAYS